MLTTTWIDLKIASAEFKGIREVKVLFLMVWYISVDAPLIDMLTGTNVTCNEG